MSDQYGLRLNWAKLRDRLSGAGIGETQLVRWLTENEFEMREDFWVTEKSGIALLEPSEILEIWPLDEALSEEERVDWSEEALASVNARLASEQYTLTSEKRASLESIVDYQDCRIPDFLCGTAAIVRSKWKRVANRLISRGDLKAMSNRRFIHVDDAAGYLVAGSGMMSAPGDNVILYPIVDDLSELVSSAVKNRHQRYIVERQLIIQGLDYFWFCLCFICRGSGPSWPILMDPSYDEDIKQIKAVALEKVLRWWPHFCARDDRFKFEGGMSLGWRGWALKIANLLPDHANPGEMLRQRGCSDAVEFIRRQVRVEK